MSHNFMKLFAWLHETGRVTPPVHYSHEPSCAMSAGSFCDCRPAAVADGRRWEWGACLASAKRARRVRVMRAEADALMERVVSLRHEAHAEQLDEVRACGDCAPEGDGTRMCKAHAGDFA